jgi:16S rRNA (guanine966-N2)-methyltransferase
MAAFTASVSCAIFAWLVLVRIIAGEFKGRRLKSPATAETRPTSDRLRETLFNVIAAHIVNANFLDLCAGSGAVGIEALSRNASHATFVDRSRKMCELINSNISLCGIPSDNFSVATSEALTFLLKSSKRSGKPWNIAFYDPPYADDHAPVLNALAENAATLLSNNALVVVEHHRKNDLPEEVAALSRFRVLKQGDSALSFYKLIGD